MEFKDKRKKVDEMKESLQKQIADYSKLAESGKWMCIWLPFTRYNEWIYISNRDVHCLMTVRVSICDSAHFLLVIVHTSTCDSVCFDLW